MIIKILVVEDFEADLSQLKSLLGKYEVFTANSCAEALQVIEKQDIGLVMLDLTAAAIDGLKLLRELKSKRQGKKLQTIIITDPTEPEKEIKGLELGAVDYLRKPLEPGSASARINVHLELLRLRQMARKILYEKGLTFDTIFDQAPIGISILYKDEPTAKEPYLIKVNHELEKILGRSREEFVSLGWEAISHPDDLKQSQENYAKLLDGKIDCYAMDKRYLKPDGSVVWVHITVAPLVLADGQQSGHICLVQDITERKQIEEALRESERSKSVLLAHLPGLAYRCYYDDEWTMQFVSAGCYELTGYHAESLLYNRDLSFNDLIAPEYRLLLRKEWEHVIKNRLPFSYEYEIITAHGQRKWVLEMGQGVFNEQGEVEALEGIILDISDRKKIENELKYNTEHNIWTGLYNRRYLVNLLLDEAKRKTRDNRALVGINLSAVQSLTIAYGFHYTQDLIKQIASALMAHCNDNRQLFHTHENRFLYYVRSYKDRKELLKFCEDVADTLESILAGERVGAGIGVLEINHHNDGKVDLLLKNLLIASERAMEFKDRDYGICFYDEEIEAKITRELEIIQELNAIAACENDRGLFLLYQPILELDSNQIFGFEALARLKMDRLGVIGPLEFIPLAEKTKLIIPIGERIIVQALRFAKRLQMCGYDTIKVFINVSVIELLEKNFAKKLLAKIEAMQLEPSNIGIEITESVFVSDHEEINRILGELKDAGVQISLDDFGTGYSTLARERELNIHSLKVDKYFVDNMLVVGPDKAITQDIVSMAHKSDHYVIAEGVEYEEQKEYLHQYGCDMIQGYLIGKPVAEDEAMAMLDRFNRPQRVNSKF